MHNWKTTEKLYTQEEMDAQRDFFKENIEYLLSKFQIETLEQYDAVHSVCLEMDIEHRMLTLSDWSIEDIYNFVDRSEYSTCASRYLESLYEDELRAYRSFILSSQIEDDREYYRYRFG